jgi:hypothetical protein
MSSPIWGYLFTYLRAVFRTNVLILMQKNSLVINALVIIDKK